MRALLTAAIVLAVGLGMCSMIQAEPYSARVEGTIIGPGSNGWTYAVFNTSTSSDYDLWVFTIEVDEGCDVFGTVTPPEWSVDTTGAPHFITWMYQTAVLPTRQSFYGFQAVFTSTPQTQYFTALFNNNVDQTCPYLEGGVTVTASPEPAGALVLLTGLGPFAALALRRRGRG